MTARTRSRAPSQPETTASLERMLEHNQKRARTLRDESDRLRADADSLQAELVARRSREAEEARIVGTLESSISQLRRIAKQLDATREHQGLTRNVAAQVHDAEAAFDRQLEEAKDALSAGIARSRAAADGLQVASEKADRAQEDFDNVDQAIKSMQRLASGLPATVVRARALLDQGRFAEAWFLARHASASLSDAPRFDAPDAARAWLSTRAELEKARAEAARALGDATVATTEEQGLRARVEAIAAAREATVLRNLAVPLTTAPPTAPAPKKRRKKRTG